MATDYQCESERVTLVASFLRTINWIRHRDMDSSRAGRKRIYYWFTLAALILVVLAVNAGLAMQTVRELTESQRSLVNTSDVISKLKDLHQSVLAAESGQRGYLLTQDESYLQPYDNALSVLDGQVEKVKQISTEIDGQRERIDLVLQLIELKKLELIETVNLALNEKQPQALKTLLTNRGRNLYREIHSLFQDIEAAEYTLREQRFKQLQQAQNEAQLVFIISGSLSFLLVITLLVVAMVNIRKDIRYRAALEQQNIDLAEQVAKRTRELQLYSDELSRSNRELEDFAFVASHDLQEPLRKIQAFGERLETQFGANLGEKGIDYLTRMRNAAGRMSRLISDLLEYSRVSTRGKAFEDVDLNETLNTILDDLEVAIDEAGGEVNSDALPIVRADGNQMYQLLLNLIGNSLKFHRPDTPPRVVLSYRTSEGVKPMHEVVIQDNGIGFDPQYAEKIFVPFQRLHGRDEYKGTGIGLAVCRRIAERHGGHLIAESEPGKGTRMIIQLPILGVTQDDASDPDHHTDG